MIEVLFETGINLVETYISVDFITAYLSPKYNDKRKYAAFTITWLVSFIELCAINEITEFETFGSFIPMVIYACYALTCLKGNIALKLWISVLTQLIITVTSTLSNIAICNIIGYNPYDMITVFNETRVISVIITKAFQFYTTRVILRYKQKNPLSGHRLILLVIIPSISIVSLCSLTKAAFNHNDIRPYILVGMGCIVLANVITYYFFTVIGKEHENDLKIKLLELRNENSEKNIENMTAFVNEMKSVRHDIKNQLLTLQGYLNANEIKEANDYINTLTNSCLPNIQDFINTADNTFNAIVNSKIALATQKGIFMEVNIKKDTVFNLDRAEISVIFGNLLDNAIEAAEHSSEKRIELDIRQEGAYLSVLITNSIRSSVLEENHSLKTSKANKDLHGIGIKSVQNIVRKHDGMITFYEEENEFCCHILI